MVAYGRWSLTGSFTNSQVSWWVSQGFSGRGHWPRPFFPWSASLWCPKKYIYIYIWLTEEPIRILVNSGWFCIHHTLYVRTADTEYYGSDRHSYETTKTVAKKAKSYYQQGFMAQLVKHCTGFMEVISNHTQSNANTHPLTFPPPSTPSTTHLNQPTNPTTHPPHLTSMHPLPLNHPPQPPNHLTSPHLTSPPPSTPSTTHPDHPPTSPHLHPLPLNHPPPKFKQTNTYLLDLEDCQHPYTHVQQWKHARSKWLDHCHKCCCNQTNPVCRWEVTVKFGIVPRKKPKGATDTTATQSNIS